LGLEPFNWEAEDSEVPGGILRQLLRVVLMEMRRWQGEEKGGAVPVGAVWFPSIEKKRGPGERKGKIRHRKGRRGFSIICQSTDIKETI